eukprot:4006524-Amphidinium_carterae.2
MHVIEQRICGQHGSSSEGVIGATTQCSCLFIGMSRASKALQVQQLDPYPVFENSLFPVTFT